MEVQVSKLRDPNFGRAMKKLDQAGNWSSVASVRKFADISSVVGRAFIDTQKDLMKRSAAYANCDENGTPKVLENGKIDIKEGCEDDFNAMITSFYSTTKHLDIPGKLTERDLKGVGITPEDWSAISWLVK